MGMVRFANHKDMWEILTRLMPEFKNMQVKSFDIHVDVENDVTVTAEIYMKVPNEDFLDLVTKQYKLVPIDELTPSERARDMIEEMIRPGGENKPKGYA